MIDELIELMHKYGMDFSDGEEDTRQSLEQAFNEDKFRFITKEGRPLGFFTWHEYYKHNKQWIWINNLIIWGKCSLFFLRDFFRKMYPNRDWVYWYNAKRNRYYYCK